MKIALIGCGYIGLKRAKQMGQHSLVGVFDSNSANAARVGKELNAPVFTSEAELLAKSGCDIVMVCTTNDSLAVCALRAVKAGKHVLVEKPGAITLADLATLRRESLARNLAVKIGFNHRFHPALLKTRQLIDQGALGPLMYLRARYGHGARVGYEKEWRSIPATGGGGELLDQGVHLLDLIFWFLGPLPLQSSMVTTSFWDMQVDDNAVLTLKDASGTWATFHVSCSEWKNTFSLELYGRTGKVLIQGLGGSYGKETLTYYKMLPQMGPPEMEAFEYPAEDPSWEKDLQNLVDHIQNKTPLWGDLESAIYAMTQVKSAYLANGFTGLPASQ